jgi:hypothetical protein
MQRSRPLTIDIVAILNFVFGTFGILGGIAGAFSLGMSLLLYANPTFLPPLPNGQPNPALGQADVFVNKVPGFVPISLLNFALGAIMGSLLIAAGFGLYRLKPWGRKLCVIWGVYTVISNLINSIYNVVLVVPAMIAYQHENYVLMQKMGMPTPEVPDWTQYSGVLLGLVIASYGIIMPLLLYRRSVSEALAGTWVPPWRRDEKEDEEERGEIDGEALKGASDPASAGIRPAQP